MTFRHLFCLLFLLLGLGIAGAQETTAAPTQADLDRAAELNRQGVAAFKDAHGNKKKLKMAADILEEGIALGGPTVYDSTLALAHTRRGLEEPAAALAAARHLIEVLPPAHPVAKEARVLLCQVRLRYKEPAAPQAGAAPAPVKAEGEVQNPVKIAGLEPRYPADMRARGQQGEVVFKGIVDHEGCIANLETVSTANKQIERSMRDAVGTWTFLPATLGGRPVAVYYSVTSNFNPR